jgi:imidazolonepropionase-like amidohydrolase
LRTVVLADPLFDGTDAGVDTVAFDSLPNELRIYQELLGLSPAQCLRAATYNVARSAGVEDDLGTLPPGRRAAGPTFWWCPAIRSRT